jgi:hypothetical protein
VAQVAVEVSLSLEKTLVITGKITVCEQHKLLSTLVLTGF